MSYIDCFPNRFNNQQMGLLVFKVLSSRLNHTHIPSQNSGSWSIYFHTTNVPLPCLTGGEPRPSFLGHLNVLVLSCIQVGLLCSHMAKWKDHWGNFWKNCSRRARCEYTHSLLATLSDKNSQYWMFLKNKKLRILSAPIFSNSYCLPEHDNYTIIMFSKRLWLWWIKRQMFIADLWCLCCM